MGLGEVIGIVATAISVFVAIYVLVIQSWAESQITTPLLQSVGADSLIIGIITILGIVILVISIFKIIASAI